MRRNQGKGKRSIRGELVAAALAAVAIASSSPNVAVAATDIFIKLDGIKGESVDDKHKDEIDVLAWSWGVSAASRNSPKQPQQPVGPGQPACAQEFSIQKSVDKASPLLFAKAAGGATISTGTFSVRKAGETPQDFLVITLSDLKVSSVSQAGSGGEDSPAESVTFTFSSATVTYTPQTAAGVAPGEPVTSTVPASCS